MIVFFLITDIFYRIASNSSSKNMELKNGKKSQFLFRMLS